MSITTPDSSVSRGSSAELGVEQRGRQEVGKRPSNRVTKAATPTELALLGLALWTLQDCRSCGIHYPWNKSGSLEATFESVPMWFDRGSFHPNPSQDDAGHLAGIAFGAEGSYAGWSMSMSHQYWSTISNSPPLPRTRQS